jgi:hypothetical protein
MRSVRRGLLLALLGLALCTSFGEAKARRPRVTALVSSTWGDLKSGGLRVVGGPVARRGWLGGERAKGVMHRGDTLVAYGLETGRLGTGVVTDDGALDTAKPRDGGYSEGLEYAARFRHLPGTQKSWDGAVVTAIWHAPGSPEPRWVVAKVLDRKNRTYRKLIADWLRQHGRTRAQIEEFTVEQLLRADVNFDGRDEVFLSFHWYEEEYTNIEDHTIASPEARKGFSYVLMRYLPPRSRRPKVRVVVNDWDNHSVTALCDLNRDGQAEIVVESYGHEWGDTRLYHWTGRGFVWVQGDLAGV